MDKFDFITRLRAALSALSEDEREAALDYYKELLEDAGSENVYDFVENLGSPEQIAADIIRENGMLAVPEFTKEDWKQTAPQADFAGIKTAKDTDSTETVADRFSKETVLMLIIAALTAPLWGGLLAGLLGTVFGILISLLVLMIVFGVIGIAFIVTGVILLIPATAEGLVILGIGLIFTALNGLLFAPAFKLSIKAIKWAVNIIINAFRKIVGKVQVNRGSVA